MTEEVQHLINLRLLYEEDRLNKVCSDINDLLDETQEDGIDAVFSTLLDELDDLDFQMTKTELKSLNIDRDKKYFEHMLKERGTHC